LLKTLGLESSGNGDSASVQHVKYRDNAAEQIVDAVAKDDPSIKLIDTHLNLCSQERCYYSAKNELLYIDPQHLSPAGARVALSSLRQLGELSHKAEPQSANVP
jgi:hypothetical protein